MGSCPRQSTAAVADPVKFFAATGTAFNEAEETTSCCGPAAMALEMLSAAPAAAKDINNRFIAVLPLNSLNFLIGSVEIGSLLLGHSLSIKIAQNSKVLPA